MSIETDSLCCPRCGSHEFELQAISINVMEAMVGLHCPKCDAASKIALPGSVKDIMELAYELIGKQLGEWEK